MSERETRLRQEAGMLDPPRPGVRTDTATDWRPVNEPLGPLDEPAKPYQSTSGMQSQAPGMQSQSMGASVGTQASGTVGPAATRPAPTGPGTVPNKYMEYEEDFRAEYDTRYAATGEPYEDYQGAIAMARCSATTIASAAVPGTSRWSMKRDAIGNRVIRTKPIHGSASRPRFVTDGIA